MAGNDWSITAQGIRLEDIRDFAQKLDILRGKRGLIVELNRLLPSNRRLPLDECTRNDPSIFKQFIEILKQLRRNQTRSQEVFRRVEYLLRDYPALLEEFKEYLPKAAPKKPITEEPPPRKQAKIFDYNSTVIDELARTIGKDERALFDRLRVVMVLNSPQGMCFFSELILALDLYAEGVITRTEAISFIVPLFVVQDESAFISPMFPDVQKNVSEIDHLGNYIQDCLHKFYVAFVNVLASREANRRKGTWFFKSLGEYDLTQEVTHGYSYHKYPENAPVLQNENVPKDLINNIWISVPFGREDYSFKLMRKNIYEDSLFICEDKRFEADREIENTKYTILVLEEVQDFIESLPPDEIKPITMTYGDHANEMLEQLRTSPAKSIAVVLERLKKKLDNAESKKVDIQDEWRDTVAKNFVKSLDHRSFYFKNNEKNSQCHKSFLTDIKKRYANRHERLRSYIAYQATGETPSFDFVGGTGRSPVYSSFTNVSSDRVQNYSSQGDTFLNMDMTGNERTFGNDLDPRHLPEYRLLYSDKEALIDTLRVSLTAMQLGCERMRSFLAYFYRNFFKFELPDDVYDVPKLLENLGGLKEEESIDLDTDEVIIVQARSKWTEVQPIDESIMFTTQKNKIRSSTQTADITTFIPRSTETEPVLYANAHFYSFLRLHYALHERLIIAKQQCSAQGYQDFLRYTVHLVKSIIDPATFETYLRELLPNESYMFFTIDKIITSMVKSLSTFINDENADQILGSYISQQNEQAYLSEIGTMAKTNTFASQMFRFVWSNDIIYITYFEHFMSPIPNSEHSNTVFEDVMAGPQPGYALELDAGLLPYKQSLDQFYQNNQISPDFFHNALLMRQGLRYAMTNTSLRLGYIPETEDSIVNSNFVEQQEIVILKDEQVQAFDSRNSFIQKVSMDGAKRLEDWMNNNSV